MYTVYIPIRLDPIMFSPIQRCEKKLVDGVNAPNYTVLWHGGDDRTRTKTTKNSV